MPTTCLVSLVRISNYYSEFYARDQDIHLGQFAEKPTFFLPDHNGSDSLGSIYSDTQVQKQDYLIENRASHSVI